MTRTIGEQYELDAKIQEFETKWEHLGKLFDKSQSMWDRAFVGMKPGDQRTGILQKCTEEGKRILQMKGILINKYF